MSKKKLAVVVSIACLAWIVGVFGVASFLEKDWSDRHDEFASALSEQYEQNGAPSKEVADKVAECIANVIVPAAEEIKCSAEEKDVLKAMGECLNSSQEMQLIFMQAMPDCMAKAL